MPEHLRVPVVTAPHGAEEPPQVTGTDEDVPARSLLAGGHTAAPSRPYAGVCWGPLTSILFCQRRMEKTGRLFRRGACG
jgi:hypothetical protein